MAAPGRGESDQRGRGGEGEWVPFAGIGAVFGLVDCLWMLWDRPNRQTLHDKIARTVVVSTPPAR